MIGVVSFPPLALKNRNFPPVVLTLKNRKFPPLILIPPLLVLARNLVPIPRYCAG